MKAVQIDKALTVYNCKVENKRTKKQSFLLLRTDVDGLLTVPRGYFLVQVIAVF